MSALHGSRHSRREDRAESALDARRAGEVERRGNWWVEKETAKLKEARKQIDVSLTGRNEGSWTGATTRDRVEA